MYAAVCIASAQKNGRRTGVEHHRVGHLENGAIHPLGNSVLLRRVRCGPLGFRAVGNEVLLELLRGVLPTIVGSQGADPAMTRGVQTLKIAVCVERIRLESKSGDVYESSAVINETHHIARVTIGLGGNGTSQIRVDEIKRVGSTASQRLWNLDLWTFAPAHAGQKKSSRET